MCGSSCETKRVRRLAVAFTSLERLEDRRQPSVFSVTSVADSGPGTLRQALLDANATPGADRITFNTPGPDYAVIAPLSPLPVATEPVTIDARTEPGYVDRPVVTLDGSHAGAGANGLVLLGGQSVVQGFVIERFDGYALVLQGGGGNLVQGNYLGTDISGEVAQGNHVGGVLILGSSNNSIGVASENDGNLISGNGGDGIRIVGPTPGLTAQVATGNQILSNFIGTDSLGTARVPNAGDGIQLIRASANAIGGTGFGSGNLISSNGLNGIEIVGDSAPSIASGAFNRVQGNRIGLSSANSPTLGNGLDGIRVGGAANSIGGVVSGAPNMIADNAHDGVNILGQAIAALSITTWSNGHLGIDLAGNGSSPPPNLGQKAPTITDVIRNGPAATVAGTFTGAPGTAYTIQFFGNDPGGDQAKYFLGSVNQSTDASGRGAFFVSIPTGLPVGGSVTATITDAAGNTSALSPATPSPASVVDLTMRGDRAGLAVQFDEPVDPASATNPANYLVLAPSGVKIRSATYDPTTFTVRLNLKRKLPAGHFVKVVVDPLGAPGVNDPAGQPIDGDGNGQSGGTFTGLVALAPKLSYTDGSSHKVSLRLEKGGVLDLFRGIDGDARVLHLNGAVASRSVLSGSVKGRNARTPIPRLVGLNGAINKLTNPPFVIGTIANA